jgi:hypothetical protein
MTSFMRAGQAVCLVALYVGVLLLVVANAVGYCTDAPESQGAWVFLTIFSPPILLVPLGGLVVLVLRRMGFVARCAFVVGISCAQVLLSFVLFC